MRKPACLCGECRTCKRRVYEQDRAKHRGDTQNRGNGKLKSTERMPWPDWYFEVEPHCGCALSRPEDMPAKISRQHLGSE